MLTLEFPAYLQLSTSIDHYLAAFFGVLLNVITVAGLCFKRFAVLGTYRWFLMAHTVNDLFSAVTMALLGLRVDYTSNTLVIVINGPLSYFSRPVLKAFYNIFVVGFLLNMALLAVTFVYRYVQICKKHYLVVLSKMSSKIIIVLVILIPIILQNVLVPLAFTYCTDFKVHVGKESWNVVALLTENKSSTFFYAMCGNFLLQASVCYGIVFFCCRSIFAYLRNAERALTAKTRKTQRMLTIVLMLQSLTPALTSSFQACALTVGVLMGFEVRWFAWILSACFVWVPTLNACISLAFVAPLRSMFQRKCMFVTAVNPSKIQTSGSLMNKIASAFSHHS
ncbi:hypothetical protein L596_020461 [Steinernema carpocapsae]|uniref:G-protein coupled receptors family 1 profile domain-containing protein n=1 Tax=Steinernema carpocapsae TaxID=34508 RepID=A0A4U5MTP3_STECR|nr:hypothetical protein L596_020461 [Steinernema carpocapsae]